MPRSFWLENENKGGFVTFVSTKQFLFCHCRLHHKLWESGTLSEMTCRQMRTLTVPILATQLVHPEFMGDLV